MIAHAPIVDTLPSQELKLYPLTYDERVYKGGGKVYAPSQMTVTQPLTDMPILDAIDEWLSVCAADGQAPTETRMKRTAMEGFIDATGIREVGKARTEHVNKWKAWMVGKSSKTIRNRLSSIRVFFQFAVDQGWIKSNPCDPVKPPRLVEGDGVRALSSEEVDRLIVSTRAVDDAGAERAALYQFMAYTGLRSVEAGRLLWQHVENKGDHPHLDLPASVTKSRKAVRLPLVPKAAAALSALYHGQEAGESVFQTIPQINTFNRDLRRAGIPKHDERGRPAGLHSLRKHLATALGRAGADIYTAQEMLRHTDIATTRKAYMDNRHMDLENKVRDALSRGGQGESPEFFHTNKPSSLDR